MADPAKYKSLSVPREDWEQLGVLATKTNRTRSKMIGRLIRFFMDNKGVKANGKVNKMLNSTEKGSIEINSVSRGFPTLFSIYGNKIFFFLVFFYISLIFFLKKIK